MVLVRPYTEYGTRQGTVIFAADCTRSPVSLSLRMYTATERPGVPPPRAEFARTCAHTYRLPGTCTREPSGKIIGLCLVYGLLCFDFLILPRIQSYTRPHINKRFAQYMMNEQNDD